MLAILLDSVRSKKAISKKIFYLGPKRNQSLKRTHKNTKMSRIAHECRVGSLSVKKGPGSAKKPNEDMDPLKDLHSPQRSESTKKDLDLLKKV